MTQQYGAPQGNYPQGSYGYPAPQQQPGNGLAVAGLVCGIVGVLIASIILGPLAVIFGGVGLSRANKGAKHKGLAIASLILGIIDIILFIVYVAVLSNNGFVVGN